MKKNNHGKSFTCHSCQQPLNKKLVRLIDKKGNKTCLNCVKEMLGEANKESGEEIVIKRKIKEIYHCVICQQEHQGKPTKIHVANYQEAGINPRELVKVCPSCLEEKVIRADFYCPRTSNGRDSYTEPEFDCYCKRTKLSDE
jgi:hypothetical protein